MSLKRILKTKTEKTMKKSTLLLWFLLGMCTIGKSDPIPAPGSVWGYAVYCNFIMNYKPWGYSYRSDDFKDTVQSNGKTYTQWLSSNKNVDKYYTRYESNKVFVFEDGKEILLYDFNLTVKDTFKCQYSMGIRTTFLTMVVKSDSIITMQNGEKRRQLILQETSNDHVPGRLTWVEGIGDIVSGFFYSPCHPVGDVIIPELIFCDKTGTLYKTKPSLSCETVDSIGVSAPITEREDIKCFVANKELTVVSNSDFTLSLFDITGRLLLTTKEAKVSLAGVLAGVYYASINLQSGEIITKQIVLE